MEKCYFKVPDQEGRRIALGSLPGTPFRTKKGLEAMMPFFQPITPPQPSDWLWDHQEEGQSFDAYKGQMHNEVTKQRDVILILPMEANIPERFLSRLGNYCRAFFSGATIEIAKPIDIAKMNVQHRINDYTNKVQYHAKNILRELEKRLHKRLFCIIGVTLSDLYPQDEWNFVFGIASIQKRTGVFSFARYDEDFFEKEDYHPDYDKIFYRSAKVMVHEIGHMFGIRHCIYYNCVMNGSNHLEENLRKPMELCPVCLRKLQSNLKFDILERYRQLLKCLPEEQTDPLIRETRVQLCQIVDKLEVDLKEKK